MITNLPGTALKFHESVANECYSVIEPLFTVTKGLTLSQVCEITGLETTTIQNWVRRGWVKSPENKKYGEDQVIRIILINTMRSSMELQQIVFLLKFINGSVIDRSDDILPDRELYNILCRIVYRSDKMAAADDSTINAIIDESVKGAILNRQNDNEENVQKLRTALRAMALAIIAGRIRDDAINAYNLLKGADEND